MSIDRVAGTYAWEVVRHPVAGNVRGKGSLLWDERVLSLTPRSPKGAAALVVDMGDVTSARLDGDALVLDLGQRCTVTVRPREGRNVLPLLLHALERVLHS